MPKTYEPIATTTLTSSQNDITFSSINGTFTDILVVAFMKLSNNANSSVAFQVNGDTGSNYSTTRLQGDGTTPESGRSSNVASGNFSGNSLRVADSAGNFSPILFNMMNYANTTTNKTFLARGNNASAGVGASVSLWRSTAAITSLRIFPVVGTIDTGTIVTLYGIKAA
jgi:hypothetical protein